MPFSEMFPAEAPEGPPRAVVRTFFSDSFDEAAAGELLDRLQRVDGAAAGCADPRARRRDGARPVGGDRVRAPAAAADAQRRRRLRAPRRRIPFTARWADEAAAALRQGEDAAYVNFLGDEGAERVRAAYPGSTWDRLAEVKRRYDPDNVFRLNQNVPPAGREEARAAA